MSSSGRGAKGAWAAKPENASAAAEKREDNEWGDEDWNEDEEMAYAGSSPNMS
jgi:hypothetical protein